MRSFIAINLPNPVKADIGDIIDRLRHAGPPARWVPAENVHLTLKFLDEIREDQVQPILAAVTEASAGTKPFDIRLSGFGVFPNPRKARVFWIGITEGYEPLKTLAQSIDQHLRPLGFVPENRPFSAHVTLARFREPGPADRLVSAASHIQYASDSISLSHIDLMRSILSPKGAEYSVVGSVPLVI